MEKIKGYFFSDVSIMLERSMRHITRSMDTIVTVTIMPIAMMLLFVYVLGGAIKTGTANYINYLLPGILLIAIANSTGYVSYRLFNDVQKEYSSGLTPCLSRVRLRCGGMCSPH